MVKARDWNAGIASCPGMCGELVAGVLPSGEPFHVTLPIEKYCTVEITLRPAASTTVKGLIPKLSKTKHALELAIEKYAPKPQSAVVQRFSNLQLGKGMASSTADIVAAVRAVADAFEEEPTREDLIEIVREIEPCHGVMYSGIHVVSMESGKILQKLGWSPRFLIVLVVPPNKLGQKRVSFEGRERFAKDYEKMLDRLLTAAKKRDLGAFAQESLKSAEINQRFVANPVYQELVGRYRELGALSVAVAHAGTLAGLLYEDTAENAMRAHQAVSELRCIFPNQFRLDVVRTTGT